MASTYRQQIQNVREAARILDQLKTAAGSDDCGFNAWPEALQFDHNEPATKLRDLGWVADRSKLTSRSKLRRYLDHVDRYCTIRCANCHAHQTKLRQRWWGKETAEAEW